MKDKSITSHSILKENKDGSLSANVLEFNRIVRIERDDKEQFPILHGKHQVTQDKIQDCIRAHHDDPMVGHPGIARTIELIQRAFIFPKMKQHVKRYIS